MAAQRLPGVGHIDIRRLRNQFHDARPGKIKLPKRSCDRGKIDGGLSDQGVVPFAAARIGKMDLA
jgi:hypothetical protein